MGVDNSLFWAPVSSNSYVSCEAGNNINIVIMQHTGAMFYAL